MARRVFGRHEYARRKLFGWSIYSPKLNPRAKRSKLTGEHLAMHRAPTFFGVFAKPPPKKRRTETADRAAREWSPFRPWGS